MISEQRILSRWNHVSRFAPLPLLCLESSRSPHPCAPPTPPPPSEVKALYLNSSAPASDLELVLSLCLYPYHPHSHGLLDAANWQPLTTFSKKCVSFLIVLSAEEYSPRFPNCQIYISLSISLQSQKTVLFFFAIISWQVSENYQACRHLLTL